MRCPSCNRIVSDDAAVCPRCDAVLDPSLLDADPTTPVGVSPLRAPAARTGAQRPRPPRAKGPSRPSAPRPKGRMPEAPRPAPRSGAAKRDWREEIGQEDWEEMPQGHAEKFVPDKALDPDDVIGEARNFVVALSTPDKIAFFGSSTMCLACFFPWKETASEGEVLGLLSAGLVVFLLSLAAIAALVVRTRSTSRSLNPLIPWVVQLFALGFSVVFCAVYAVVALDTTSTRAPVGNYEMWVSKPSFGLILAFLSGVVASLGTVMGLKGSR